MNPLLYVFIFVLIISKIRNATILAKFNHTDPPYLSSGLTLSRKSQNFDRSQIFDNLEPSF